MSDFPAIAHVALTVRDLDASTAWYNRAFDAEPILEMKFDDFDRRIYQLPNGQVLGITHHKTGDPGRFDPTVIGLDHVGFACAGLDELQTWATRLAERGVQTSGIQETAYGTILSFSDPDGNAFDFFIRPATASS